MYKGIFNLTFYIFMNVLKSIEATYLSKNLVTKNLQNKTVKPVLCEIFISFMRLKRK